MSGQKIKCKLREHIGSYRYRRQAGGELCVFKRGETYELLEEEFEELEDAEVMERIRKMRSLK